MASDATDLDLDETLRAKLEEAESAHPSIRLDRATFLRHLADKTSADSPLTTLLAPDLYLARACGEGMPPALAAFRELHGGDIRDVHARSSGSRPPLDELTQAVHEKLFVGSHPKILDYAGTGKLKNWVRVVASRTLVDLIRERDPAAEPHDSEAPLGIPAPDDDPELQYLKLKYRSEIKEAFEHAVTTLAAEERNALREYYVHGLGIDQIAELRGIHRSTAARRVSSAREAVLKATRRVLMERTGLGQTELESLVRMVESQMHVTVERVLGTA
jgi:RNA polymerase sigma-70 factor (ECF subfamily)